MGSLIISGNTLFGTTVGGGTNGQGIVFSLNIDGTDYKVLHNFAGTDGGGPMAQLTLFGNILYGTTSWGGTNGTGTLFKINTDGSGFATLYQFAAGTPTGADGSGRAGPNYINSNGASPECLTLSGNTLYGSTATGGYTGGGTVYRINTDGSGFATLYAFSYYTMPGPPGSGNRDGSTPTSPLALFNRTLYGTCLGGGTNNLGTIFAVSLDGGFQTLHTFGSATNDETSPGGGIYLSGGTLYGTTTVWPGAAFALSMDGTGFSALPLPNFSSISSNNTLYGGTALSLMGLVGSTNALYGIGAFGGSYGGGAVFSIAFPPQVTLLKSGAKIIITWPTNYAGFDYKEYIAQSTTNLLPPVWTTNLPAPVVVNGQYTVTNPVSQQQQFFRLAQ